MPKFKYHAVDDAGNHFRGTMESQTFHGAADELKAKGYWILNLVDLSQSVLYKELTLGGPKVKSGHFTVFCRQLATLYKSGISLVEAVRVLGEQAESKVMKKVLLEISGEMQKGSQFSAAAVKYPTVFSDIFVHSVRAGETSGNLDEMLSRIAVYYEKKSFTQSKKSDLRHGVSVHYEHCYSHRRHYFNEFCRTQISRQLRSDGAGAASADPICNCAQPMDEIVLVSGVSGFTSTADSFKKPSLTTLRQICAGLYQASNPGLRQALAQTSAVPVQPHILFLVRFSHPYAADDVHPVNRSSNEVIAKLIRESREGLRSGSSIADPFKEPGCSRR